MPSTVNSTFMKSTLMGKGADRVLWLDLFKFLMNDADVIDMEHDIQISRFSMSQARVLQPGIYLPAMDDNKHAHIKPLLFHSHSVRRRSCSKGLAAGSDNHGFLRRYLPDTNNWFSPTSIPNESELRSILCNTSLSACSWRTVSP